jgi:hypothetical protein
MGCVVEQRPLAALSLEAAQATLYPQAAVNLRGQTNACVDELCVCWNDHYSHCRGAALRPCYTKLQ